MRTMLVTAALITSFIAFAGDERPSKTLADAAIKAINETPEKLADGFRVRNQDAAKHEKMPAQAPREFIEPKSHEECLAENGGVENVVYHRCRAGYSKPLVGAP